MNVFIESMSSAMAASAPFKVDLKSVNSHLDDKAVLLLTVVRRWIVPDKGNSSKNMIKMDFMKGGNSSGNDDDDDESWECDVCLSCYLLGIWTAESTIYLPWST
ncbi:unnamed protein product [Cuscuta epithymum]|uniref:Uncharacterized protein n=1 Tax=Cuscuta epithymum TaxID=186058 RepID=A0AAV0EYM2_9ASTE|nr:unnamed protein product [Cuscuta epithymum]